MELKLHPLRQNTLNVKSAHESTEKYVIDNDKKLFDFTESWVNDMKKSMKSKKDFKVVR